MPKTTDASKAGIKIINNGELGLNHGHKHHLSDALWWLNYKWSAASIPAGHHELALVVWIYKAYQITQNYAMFMTKARPRQ